MGNIKKQVLIDHFNKINLNFRKGKLGYERKDCGN